eukprot:2810598-Pyramimonas_sp.AAC.1
MPTGRHSVPGPRSGAAASPGQARRAPSPRRGPRDGPGPAGVPRAETGRMSTKHFFVWVEGKG